MKIELYFVKHQFGYDYESLFLGKFRTKKAAYQYVKANRKFFCKGYFTLCIYKNSDYHFENVRAQDILNV